MQITGGFSITGGTTIVIPTTTPLDVTQNWVYAYDDGPEQIAPFGNFGLGEDYYVLVNNNGWSLSNNAIFLDGLMAPPGYQSIKLLASANVASNSAYLPINAWKDPENAMKLSLPFRANVPGVGLGYKNAEKVSYPYKRFSNAQIHSMFINMEVGTNIIVRSITNVYIDVNFVSANLLGANSGLVIYYTGNVSSLFYANGKPSVTVNEITYANSYGVVAGIMVKYKSNALNTLQITGGDYVWNSANVVSGDPSLNLGNVEPSLADGNTFMHFAQGLPVIGLGAGGNTFDFVRYSPSTKRRMVWQLLYAHQNIKILPSANSWGVSYFGSQPPSTSFTDDYATSRNSLGTGTKSNTSLWSAVSVSNDPYLWAPNVVQRLNMVNAFNNNPGGSVDSGSFKTHFGNVDSEFYVSANRYFLLGWSDLPVMYTLRTSNNYTIADWEENALVTAVNQVFIHSDTAEHRANSYFNHIPNQLGGNASGYTALYSNIAFTGVKFVKA
jgi:hypothetical protein